MRLLEDSISKEELRKIALSGFGNLVKAVVDLKKGALVIDAALHADAEALLLAQGSNQTDLWGVNLYPDLEGEDFIEFDSMINLRPGQNSSRGVDDPEVQKRIRTLVLGLVK